MPARWRPIPWSWASQSDRIAMFVRDDVLTTSSSAIGLFRIRREDTADQPDGKRQLLVGNSRPGTTSRGGVRDPGPRRSSRDRPLPGDPAAGPGGLRAGLPGPRRRPRPRVAIKVPNPERVAGPGDVEAYLAEARTLARLDHPNIVPVHDVGRTDDGLCYVVSKYIEGSDLAERLRQGRPSFRESAELVADGRRGAAPCAHPRPGPPRRQAGQHPDRRDRASRAWPTSGWRSGTRTSARAPGSPARRPT